MMKKQIIAGIFYVILILAFARAQVSSSGNTIETNYGVGDLISGTLNVTFTNANLDSIVRTNLGETISLRELLNAHNFPPSTYNCSTANCLSGYAKKNEINSVGVSGGKVVVGLVAEGRNVRNLRNIKVSAQGRSGPLCFPSLKLDVLGKNERLMTSSSYLNDDSCYGPRYGCFESVGVSYQPVTIPSNSEYCEKIALPAAPAFKLGANVINSTQGSASLEMRLYSLEGNYLKKCTLPVLNSQSQIVTCTLDYTAPAEKEYLVCIKASGSSSYKIRAETHEPCGSDTLGNTFVSDYEIFAQNLKFGSPFIELNKDSFFNSTGTNLEDYFANYISSTYNGLCEPYCVIPLKFFGIDQILDFSNTRLVYDRDGGQGVESSSLYELEQKNASITSPQLVLNIGLANFTIPSDADEDYLEIYFDGTRVVRKPLNLSMGFDFGLVPRFSAFGLETNYYASGAVNITKTVWKFGDGSAVQTVVGRGASHRYLQQGQFTIEVEATRSGGAVSKRRFAITVGNPRVAANTTIVQYRRQLNDLAINISAYDLWIQQALKTNLDYSGLNSSLQEIGFAYAQASNDSDFASIMNDLIALHMPTRLYSGTRGTLPLIIGADNFDVLPIEEISAQDVDDAALKKGIASWMSQNYNAEANFEFIEASYDGGSEGILTKFKIESKPKQNSEEAYLVLSYPADQIIFSSPYNHKSTQTGTYIALGNGNEIFEFAIADKVSVEELGAYISPSVSALGTFEEGSENSCNYNKKCDSDFGETRANCPGDCRPWGIATFLIILIVVLGIAAFLVIRRWYATNYEKSLFENTRDLVNIMAFISNSRRAGMNEKDLRKKLKTAGWTGEQISYALKKLSRTRENQSGEGDARFIKRPSL